MFEQNTPIDLEVTGYVICLAVSISMAEVDLHRNKIPICPQSAIF